MRKYPEVNKKQLLQDHFVGKNNTPKGVITNSAGNNTQVVLVKLAAIKLKPHQIVRSGVTVYDRQAKLKGQRS
jgi:hypothetical protein